MSSSTTVVVAVKRTFIKIGYIPRIHIGFTHLDHGVLQPAVLLVGTGSRV
ncbi:hypothetical protein NYE24_26850 [Paenibacillus sp. FSL H7-0350]